MHVCFRPRQDYTVKQGNHNCKDLNDLMTGNYRKSIPPHVWANTSRSKRVYVYVNCIPVCKLYTDRRNKLNGRHVICKIILSYIIIQLLWCSFIGSVFPPGQTL